MTSKVFTLLCSVLLIGASNAQTLYQYGNNTSFANQSALFDAGTASTYSITYSTGGTSHTTGPFISSGYLNNGTLGQSLLYSNLGSEKYVECYNPFPGNPSVFKQYQLEALLTTSPPEVRKSSVVNGYISSGYLKYDATVDYDSYGGTIKMKSSGYPIAFQHFRAESYNSTYGITWLSGVIGGYVSSGVMANQATTINLPYGDNGSIALSGFWDGADIKFSQFRNRTGTAPNYFLATAKGFISELELWGHSISLPYRSGLNLSCAQYSTVTIDHHPVSTAVNPSRYGWIRSCKLAAGYTLPKGPGNTLLTYYYPGDIVTFRSATSSPTSTPDRYVDSSIPPR